jgi:hypothetical protein
MHEPAAEDPAEVLGRVELAAEDHTRIMQAVFDNLFPVLRNLDIRPYVADGEAPTGDAVLEALLTVPDVDDYTKARIRDVLAVRRSLTELEESGRLSATLRARTDQVERLVEETESVSATIDQLESALSAGEFRHESTESDFLQPADENEFVEHTVELLIELLEDGQKSVYWPNARFYHQFASTTEESPMSVQRSLVGDIANGDSKGLIGGAAGGCAAGSLAGGVGCGPGAAAGGLAGGVAGSASEAIGAALDAIFD